MKAALVTNNSAILFAEEQIGRDDWKQLLLFTRMLSS
jgi:hypothetical protein